MLLYSSVSLSLWHSECDALKRCPRIHSPFFLPTLFAFIWQKSTPSLWLVWTLSSLLHLKTFLTCTNPSCASVTIKTVHHNKTLFFLKKNTKIITMTPQHILSVSQSLYKFWNIHIRTYFSLHFFCPFSKRNIFLHFKACYIYEEGRKCPQGSTVTHPRVLLQWGDEPQTTHSHLLQHTHTQTCTHGGQEMKHYGGEVSIPRKAKSQKHRGSKMFSKWLSNFKNKKKTLLLEPQWLACCTYFFWSYLFFLVFSVESKSAERENNNTQPMEISLG